LPEQRRYVDHRPCADPPVSLADLTAALETSREWDSRARLLKYF